MKQDDPNLAGEFVVFLVLWIFLYLAFAYLPAEEVRVPAPVVSPWYEMNSCAHFAGKHVEVLSVGRDTYLVAKADRDPRKLFEWGMWVDHGLFEEHASPTTCPERRVPTWARKRG